MNKVKIKKSAHSYRTIYVPNFEERKVLRAAKHELDWIYLKMGMPDCVHGFRFGRSAVSNAIKHVNYKYSISVDLKDFFDSITPRHVKDYLSDHLIYTCFIDGAPRQGLCTSPVISNIVMYHVDQLLSNINGVMYTRYADDITISFNEKYKIEPVLEIAKYHLSQFSFTINEHKTKVQHSSNGRRIITGIGVSDDVYPTRSIKRKIRAAKHQNQVDSELGLTTWTNFIRNTKKLIDVTFEPIEERGKRYILCKYLDRFSSRGKTLRYTYRCVKEQILNDITKGLLEL